MHPQFPEEFRIIADFTVDFILSKDLCVEMQRPLLDHPQGPAGFFQESH